MNHFPQKTACIIKIVHFSDPVISTVRPLPPWSAKKNQEVILSGFCWCQCRGHWCFSSWRLELWCAIYKVIATTNVWLNHAILEKCNRFSLKMTSWLEHVRFFLKGDTYLLRCPNKTWKKRCAWSRFAPGIKGLIFFWGKNGKNHQGLKTTELFWVVDFLKIFYFHPELWGRWTHFDSYFSDGWFNHQPVLDV